ncbi:MAG: hypothetical protein JWM33_2198 [Caulobacteraceae bacterium]|nr:hypothetical protein [Caulobacteraceae bacterium]
MAQPTRLAILSPWRFILAVVLGPLGGGGVMVALAALTIPHGFDGPYDALSTAIGVAVLCVINQLPLNIAVAIALRLRRWPWLTGVRIGAAAFFLNFAPALCFLGLTAGPDYVTLEPTKSAGATPWPIDPTLVYLAALYALAGLICALTLRYLALHRAPRDPVSVFE